MNAQKEKSFQGSHKLPQAHKKGAIKMKVDDAHVKMLFIEGSPLSFIMPKQKIGENDLHELLGNDSGYNKGTICVVNG